MFKGLSLHQAPPYEAPFRFFITAPIFAIIAGFYIAISDASSFSNRLSSESLSIVHLLTIGFMSMVMMGAMQQMLPVLAGVIFNNAKQNARYIHLFLTVGALLFFIGFYYSIDISLQIGILFVAISMLWFIAVVANGLKSVKNQSESVRAFNFALFRFFLVSFLERLLGCLIQEFWNTMRFLQVCMLAGCFLAGLYF